MFKKLTMEEEKTYRQWARDNYKIGAEVNPLWHPVVRYEIHKMAHEALGLITCFTECPQNDAGICFPHHSDCTRRTS